MDFSKKVAIFATTETTRKFINDKNSKFMEQFKNIHPDIKIAICEWFGKNINRWQRVNSCCDEFRSYLYDSNGNYLIGGKEIGEFISYIDKAF